MSDKIHIQRHALKLRNSPYANAHVLLIATYATSSKKRKRSALDTFKCVYNERLQFSALLLSLLLAAFAVIVLAHASADQPSNASATPCNTMFC